MSDPALDIHDLRFAYPGGDPVLDGVTFRVQAGERVAIIGANGSGKSTLLLQLNGLLTPTAGSVSVCGTPVADDTLRAVRRHIGLVFQDPDDQLFLPSLVEDVAFGPLNQGVPPGDAEARARNQLDHFGLLHAADRAAHHLSGGEKRLAALATALVLEPEILALDEPTASLDARARKRVVNSLEARSETLLVATHDLDVARALCSRVIVLAAGGVAIDGPSRDILSDPDLLHRHGLHEPLTG